MTQTLKSTFSALLMVLSALGLINVYSNNDDVQALAEATACAGCKTTLTRMERSPLAQTFYLQVSRSNEVIVRCSKAMVFIGDYTCEKR